MDRCRNDGERSQKRKRGTRERVNRKNIKAREKVEGVETLCSPNVLRLRRIEKQAH